MERYLVEFTDDNGIYERSSNYFVHLTIRDSIDPFTTSSPSEVSITITDPCGVALIAEVSMVSLGSGIYTHDYAIESDAPYGKYNVNISTFVHTMVKNYDFYILPWNIIRDIRRYSGIEEYKSVSDEDIAGIAWQSLQEVSDSIYEQHSQEAPRYDPDVGVMFNGTNTTVRTQCENLADRNADGNITGFGEESCGTDITGYWLDNDYGHNVCNITVINSTTGRLTVTQTDGTAIPNNNRGVYLTYWTQYRTYDETIFREAVSYLAAHKIVKRFSEMDKSTLVDIESNKIRYLAEPNRLWTQYESARDMIRRPMIGGTR